MSEADLQYTKCDKHEQADVNDTERYTTCSSLDTCYNFDVYKYDNSLCSNPYESCGSILADQELEGCILTQWCETESFYRGMDAVYNCPDGNKSPPDKGFDQEK